MKRSLAIVSSALYLALAVMVWGILFFSFGVFSIERYIELRHYAPELRSLAALAPLTLAFCLLSYRSHRWRPSARLALSISSLVLVWLSLNAVAVFVVVLFAAASALLFLSFAVNRQPGMA